MLRARAAESALVFALATVVTIAIAAPVLRSPSARLFGMAIVGRHYDPFVAMEQMARPPSASVYAQPITDLPGALFARLSTPVAGYNWLVLLSFPLSALTAYLLARYLSLSPAGAAIAAMAYAFSPFHLAHAAYHPHVAQIQWIPLYLLALWHCLDRATPAAVGMLVVATITVTLSNLYGGLIAVVLTPFAVAAHWFVPAGTGTRSLRRLGVTVATLSVLATCALVYASYAAGAVVDNAALAFPRTDLIRYGARWWSYLVPPVEHPLWGGTALRIWDRAGVREGLLEQQVSLGLGIVALGLIGVLGWLIHLRPPPAAARAPILIIVAVAAFVCSLAPEGIIGGFSGPSVWLHEVAPMFRSYARFGVVVQLMAALLAGIGVERLWHARTLRARVACVALVLLVAGEYAVRPSAMSRDVLPTTAHRWVAEQQTDLRVLDCSALDQESQSVTWLTGGRVTLLGGPIRDCTDAHLAEQLALHEFTHVLVRRDAASTAAIAARHGADGLEPVAQFDDARVFAVTAAPPVIYTATTEGFHRRERDSEWAWQWMGGDASWIVVNASDAPVVATLALELSAFHHPRRMEVRLDGQPVQQLFVEPSRRVYQIGPLTVPTGSRELGFHPAEAPTVARDVIDNKDPRRLSFALGASQWIVQEQQP